MSGGRGGEMRTWSLHEDGVGVEEVLRVEIAEVFKPWQMHAHIGGGAVRAAAVAAQNVPHLQQQIFLSAMPCTCHATADKSVEKKSARHGQQHSLPTESTGSMAPGMKHDMK
jgi:hypothetical protein